MMPAAELCHWLQILLHYTRLTALCPGLPGWAGTRKVKAIWILLKQETVSGSGISWAICKSAPSSRQITTPAPHHSVFYRPDALPAAQPTASKKTTHSIKELKACWALSLLQISINICRWHLGCSKAAAFTAAGWLLLNEIDTVP